MPFNPSSKARELSLRASVPAMRLGKNTRLKHRDQARAEDVGRAGAKGFDSGLVEGDERDGATGAAVGVAQKIGGSLRAASWPPGICLCLQTTC